MSKIESFYIGQTETISKSFSEEDVRFFSELSLDNNPIHLDQNYASNTFFENRIVHGFLYSSLISAVIGTKLPGPGSIYMKQELKFLKPVYFNETVKAVVTISSINKEKSVLELETKCFKNGNELVVDGIAVIKLV